jgi:hypothetical protein
VAGTELEPRSGYQLNGSYKIHIPSVEIPTEDQPAPESSGRVSEQVIGHFPAHQTRQALQCLVEVITQTNGAIPQEEAAAQVDDNSGLIFWHCTCQIPSRQQDRPAY